MTASLTYSVVTPAKNEANNLRRLAESLKNQTVGPEAWIIVDDNSADDTLPTAKRLADETPWVQAVNAEGSQTGMTRGGPVVAAFHRGLGALSDETEIVVKLDADISFDPEFFGRLIAAFEADPNLGITGGTCYELEGGRWRARPVGGRHVRGACRAYRRACLEQVLPLENRSGWDGIDEIKASLRGWRTGTLPGAAFYHHRTVGERDGRRYKRWLTEGDTAHFVGYRPSYLILRAIHRARHDWAALAMLWGYAAAAIKGAPRCVDDDVVAYVRREQSLRTVARRLLRPII